MKPLFKGIATALITPFSNNGKIDYTVLAQLIERQIENGAAALVIAGTTGEGSTLCEEEFRSLIAASADIIGKRVPLIAGSGSNCTAVAVKNSILAQECGADALLIVTPYYNKTTQSGAIKHFQTIADQIEIPVILYNVPSRTGFDLEPETCQELSSHPRIIGIKEASGRLSKMAELRFRCPQLALYSGNDDQIVPCLSLGGCGAISVVSNLIPAEMNEMYRCWTRKETEKAEKTQLDILPLLNALFYEINPVPIKYAMSRIGYPAGAPRLPLIECSALAKEKVNYALKKFGLIK